MESNSAHEDAGSVMQNCLDPDVNQYDTECNMFGNYEPVLSFQIDAL